MEITSTSYMHAAQSLHGPHQGTALQDDTQSLGSRPAIQDEVRFSEEGLRMSDAGRADATASGDGEIRFDLVNRIKSEIASGTYETPDKMDIALDRLLQGLNPRT